MRSVLRLACVLLSFVLLLGSARAQLSPGLQALQEQYDAGTPMALTVSVQADALADTSREVLGTIQKYLGKMSLYLVDQKGEDGASLLQWLYEDAPVLTAAVQEKGDRTLVTFPDSDIAFATAAEDADALSLLTGEDMLSLPHFAAARQALWAAFDGIYALFAEYDIEPKYVDAVFRIEGVGSAGQYERYRVDEDTWNALWPGLLQVLSPALDALLPAGSGEAKAALAAMTFSGQTEWMRVFDKENNNWGFQWTTHMTDAAGTARKVSLLVGWRADKGFYVKLNAPKTQGKDALKFTLGGVYTLREDERTLKVDMDYTRQENGEKQSLSLTGTLKNAALDAGEHITGKCTLEDSGAERTYTFTPDVQVHENGLAGTVGVSIALPRSRKTSFAFHVTLAPTEDVALPNAQNGYEDLEAWEIRFLLRDVEEDMMASLLNILADMEPQERAHIAHALRTASWMTGESVPVPDEPLSNRTIEEEPKE